MKTNFLWAISKCGVKYFEQSAMDLRLWLLRAHYSWISWLMVMHLLQSLLCLACFYETKFLWLFPNAEWNTLSSPLWIFVCNSSKHKTVEFCGWWMYLDVWLCSRQSVRVLKLANCVQRNGVMFHISNVSRFACKYVPWTFGSLRGLDSPRGFSFSDHWKLYSIHEITSNI